MAESRHCKNHPEITGEAGIFKNKWVMRLARAALVGIGSKCAADIFNADSSRFLPKGSKSVDIPCSNCNSCLRVRRFKGHL